MFVAWDSATNGKRRNKARWQKKFTICSRPKTIYTVKKIYYWNLKLNKSSFFKIKRQRKEENKKAHNYNRHKNKTFKSSLKIVGRNQSLVNPNISDLINIYTSFSPCHKFQSFKMIAL